MKKQEPKMYAALGAVKRYSDKEVEDFIKKSVPSDSFKEVKSERYSLNSDLPYVPSRVTTFEELNKEVFGSGKPGRHTQGTK